jgi:hypothetical protein
MKPIFSRNIDIEKMAFLNWRIEKDDHILNLLNIAEGFLHSSIELAKLCLADNEDKKADIIIFPILTNANHGIELYLKSLNWTLNELMGIDRTIEGKHNLKQIFQTIKAKFKEYKGNITYKEFGVLTIELENYIDELFAKIQATPQNDKMDFSRYSISNNNDDHFYVSDYGCVEIDLENLIVRFETIKRNLEQLTDFLYYNELQQDV